ncbi:hypothetical protein C5167_011740 [Papaver somniferum]|nr:hypothetical protein C5167_011740 [Papaver somniferum]
MDLSRFPISFSLTFSAKNWAFIDVSKPWENELINYSLPRKPSDGMFSSLFNQLQAPLVSGLLAMRQSCLLVKDFRTSAY